MTNRKSHTRNILVITDPPAAPGYLPRVRYICDYLVRRGYNVTLLTEKYEPLPFEHSYNIVTIPIYYGSTIDWALKTVWTLLTNWHNSAFAKKALSTINYQLSTYDAVLCSAFSDFPLGAAKIIANRLNTPLICDIRDLDEQVENSSYQYHHKTWWTMPFRRLYRAIHIRRRNAVLSQADAITTVSPWHVGFIRQFNQNVHLVYNGYDDKQFYPEDIQSERFTISYIGSLFNWQQPALTKVKQAIEELQLPVSLEMHTPQSNPVPHDQLGNAIRRSSIMLVLTSPDTHGMMTTKFFEAFGCAKPILCVPSDKGCLADTIQSTNAGIATDEISEIKQFIVAKYREWQQNGFTRQQTRQREAFSRETQCQQLEALL